jgi:hypothetical protein
LARVGQARETCCGSSGSGGRCSSRWTEHCARPKCTNRWEWPAAAESWEAWRLRQLLWLLLQQQLLHHVRRPRRNLWGYRWHAVTVGCHHALPLLALLLLLV